MKVSCKYHRRRANFKMSDKSRKRINCVLNNLYSNNFTFSVADFYLFIPHTHHFSLFAKFKRFDSSVSFCKLHVSQADSYMRLSLSKQLRYVHFAKFADFWRECGKKKLEHLHIRTLLVAIVSF